MRKILFFIVTFSIVIPICAAASTESATTSTKSATTSTKSTPVSTKSTPISTDQLGIGVFDYIISRTEFNVGSCEVYSCNYVSPDKTIKMVLRRANLVQHNTKDLNFLLDIDFDSKLFKSGLLVQYYNDIALIRVYIKGASLTIEATRKDEITKLQSWLKSVLSLIK